MIVGGFYRGLSSRPSYRFREPATHDKDLIKKGTFIFRRVGGGVKHRGGFISDIHWRQGSYY